MTQALTRVTKIRSSTGVAASWLSPLGPMTFVFSTNLSKANSDQTESFNFNLGTTFLVLDTMKKIILIFLFFICTNQP